MVCQKQAWLSRWEQSSGYTSGELPVAGGGPGLGALCERRPKGIAVKRSGLWQPSVRAAWEMVCACGKATGEGQASLEPAPEWILMLTFSCSPAVAALSHHLVALDAATAAAAAPTFANLTVLDTNAVHPGLE